MPLLWLTPKPYRPWSIDPERDAAHRLALRCLALMGAVLALVAFVAAVR